ncbi:MAG: 5'-nucleotidase C-terminal domain-containing protein [Symbiobacteriaceae bacterium]|nr:5'-nucleotidase C-terminal domain-containing protein [Symbiobacteriaceae bacterium]
MRKQILGLPKLLLTAVALCLTLGMVAPAALAEADTKELTTINILHTNDVHGRLFQVDNNNAGMIGIHRIAEIKNNTENAILVDIGDVLHGLPLVNVNRGQNAIDLMTAAGYQVMTPGNHDFNFGSDRLAELAEYAAQQGMHIISANVYDIVQDAPFLPATHVVEVAGFKVGFFGLTTQTTPIVTNPVNVETLEFLSYLAAAEAAIEALQQQEVDVIVALAHVAHGDILAMLEALTVKPDVVIEGHDHLLGTNEKSGVIIAGDGQYQENIGFVTITLAANGDIVDISASQVNKSELGDLEGDPEVLSLAEAMKETVIAQFSEVIAKSGINLSSARGDAETNGVRNSEQPLGNLVADAMRYISKADMAITNGGGLRADIKEGDITRGDLNSVLPFGNVLVVKEATSQGIKEALENGLSTAPAPLGGFPQISGLMVSYDPSKEAGSRVISMTLANGTVLDPDDTTTVYTLATNDFMANGGDGYASIKLMPTLAEIDSLDSVFESYIVTALGGTVTPQSAAIDGRITPIPPLGKMPITLTIDSLVVSQGKMLLPEPPLPPQIINDRTMLPFRYLVETVLEGEVLYDEATQQITATVEGHVVQMTVDVVDIIFDGESYNYGQAPVIVDDYTLIPLRAFDLLFDKLGWDAATRTVTIEP